MKKKKKKEKTTGGKIIKYVTALLPGETSFLRSSVRLLQFCESLCVSKTEETVGGRMRTKPLDLHLCQK